MSPNRASAVATPDKTQAQTGNSRSDVGRVPGEMRFGREAFIDPETGEVLIEGEPVLPSHFKCPHSGRAREVENPAVWVFPEGGDD